MHAHKHERFVHEEVTRVQDGELKVVWMDTWWSGWAELLARSEYKKLMDTAKEKLAVGILSNALHDCLKSCIGMHDFD